MKDLIVFGTILTLIGIVVFLQWTIKNKLLSIDVNWGTIREKLYENLVFAILMTALLIWFQILVMILIS